MPVDLGRLSGGASGITLAVRFAPELSLAEIPKEGEMEPWQAAPARTLMRYPLEHLVGWRITFTDTADATEPHG